MQKLIFTALVLFLAGCASIHESNYATPDGSSNEGASSGSGIVISGAENGELSSRYFGEVNFTFENKTAEWIRIKKVTLDFENPALNEAVKVPIGADLIAWATAAQQIKAIQDYNTAMLLGSVLTVGAVTAAVGHDPMVRTVGVAAMLGATGGVMATAIRDDKARAELVKMVPASHLLADDFVIPPGLHAKKWITFYTKNPDKIPRVATVLITYTLENGKTEKARLRFRGDPSTWEASP